MKAPTAGEMKARIGQSKADTMAILEKHRHTLGGTPAIAWGHGRRNLALKDGGPGIRAGVFSYELLSC